VFSTPNRSPDGEKSVDFRLGSHGFALCPGLHSQTTFASALAGTSQSAANASSAATSGLRVSMRGS
jgi:hypothetical protein